MDIFVAKLRRDNVFLRHHTSNNNYQQIKQDGMLYANFTQVEEEFPLPSDFQPVPVVYFQLVKGIKPRYPDYPYIVELYFPPELLLNKQIIIHPNGWFFGSTKSIPQYSTMRKLSKYHFVILTQLYNITISMMK